MRGTMSVSLPEVTTNAGMYVLEWEPENIRISIDRLYDTKGITTGEVAIQYKPPEGSEYGHLHLARLNLTSTRERQSLTNYLASRVSDIDWGAVIEQACVKTLEKHREGEPCTMVGNLPIAEQSKYSLYPLMLEGQPNLIFGPGGSGKTTVAAMFALQYVSSHEGSVLWLDYEWFQDEVNSLIKRLKDGMGLDPELEIAYRFCAQPLADDILSIQRMVLETNAKLVVVDSVGAACGGDPMAPDVVLRYFSALRSLRVTTLSLDHVAKENRGPFGSVYKLNSARNVWEAVKGTSDKGCLAVGLHHRKINSGPLLKPLGYQFSYSPTSIMPQKTDARSIPEVLATMAQSDQIEAALLRGAMTPQEISEETGMPASSISPLLSRFKDRKFIKLGGGKWGVRAGE